MSHVAVQAKFRRAFSEFIAGNAYPCVGAKAAHAQESIEYCFGHHIESAADDETITQYIQQFALRARPNVLFSSLVVGFVHHRGMSELDFEKALWNRLQALHDLDRTEFSWDPHVSNDPQSPEFSLSIGGKGFYIIGLHPNASRMARRFEYPALVFNLHSQFEKLRADGRYLRMTGAIAQRDIELCGTSNPMLSKHGESSEARQYSGRQTRADWQCPFRATAEKTVDAT